MPPERWEQSERCCGIFALHARAFAGTTSPQGRSDAVRVAFVPAQVADGAAHLVVRADEGSKRLIAEQRCRREHDRILLFDTDAREQALRQARGVVELVLRDRGLARDLGLRAAEQVDQTRYVGSERLRRQDLQVFTEARGSQQVSLEIVAPAAGRLDPNLEVGPRLPAGS